MSSHFRWLAFILVLVMVSLWIVLPDTTKPDFLLRGYDQEALAECLQVAGSDETAIAVCNEKHGGEFDYHQGLDLVGGLRVLLEAELPRDSYSESDLREAANNVERRVNALGLAEATVRVQGSSRILVELPGVTDRQQAIGTIQQTALLEFVDFGGLSREIGNLVGRYILTDQQVEIQQAREALAAERSTTDPEATAEAKPADDETDEEGVQRLVHPYTGDPFTTVMTGAGLASARAEPDTQSNAWLIRFDINTSDEGGAGFGSYTGSRIGEPMAIVLDGEVLSAPTIQAALPTGGVITGNFTEEEAKTLALQLRSGALRIPLRVESATQVGATLGQESVELSIRAGLVGVIVILSFMLIYYRVPGISADLALIVFMLLNIAAFKLIPVTLTLPAITGFLISVGTAVDGNILIFERLKEELRDGKPLDEALDSGFDRAWTSIRDSNISTIIICGILFLFGQTPGASIVSGFAITLALGLALNLFTAVIVTRTFLYLIITYTHNFVSHRRWLLGV